MKQFKLLVVTVSFLTLLIMFTGCAKSEGLFSNLSLEAAARDGLDLLPGDALTTDNLANLTKLSAADSNIADLSGIEYCINLNVLELPDNKISDIYPIYSLNNLVSLNLVNNKINQIPGPCSLFTLVALNLGGNQISDISALSSLSNLAVIILYDNQINDISPLASLFNLTRLDLNGNRIDDISALLENDGLGAGDEIYLKDNNLDLSEGSEDLANIKILENMGVRVIY